MYQLRDFFNLSIVMHINYRWEIQLGFQLAGCIGIGIDIDKPHPMLYTYIHYSAWKSMS